MLISDVAGPEKFTGGVAPVLTRRSGDVYEAGRVPPVERKRKYTGVSEPPPLRQPAHA